MNGNRRSRGPWTTSGSRSANSPSTGSVQCVRVPLHCCRPRRPPNSAAVNTATAAAHLVGASAASADRDPKQHHLEDLLGSASGRPPASDQADRPHGHYFDNFNREDGYGLVTTLVHPRVKVRVICLLLLQNWVLLSCLVLKFLCIVPVTNGDL
jgi:hypothetical protein